MHDNDRRTPGDFIYTARSRYDDAGSRTQWFKVLLGSAVFAFVAYMLFTTPRTETTGDIIRQTSTSTTATMTAPTPTTQPR